MSTGADDLTTEHYFGSLVNHILNRDPINPTGNYASGVVLDLQCFAEDVHE